MNLKSTLLKSALALSFLPLSLAAPILSVPNTPVNRHLLQKLDLDFACMGSSRDRLEIHLDERAEQILSNQKAYKKNLLFGSRVEVQDAEEQFREIREKDDLGIYHNYDEMMAEMKAAASNYPTMARYFVAGKTFEGRDIPALELGNVNSKSEKKSFLVMGTHHAREWISAEVPLASIQDLLNHYASDPEARQILDTSTLVYVPMLNVDGGIYSRQKSSMWRKNRNTENTFDRAGVGVDNNRNYSYKWGVSGASSSPWSNTYKGPDPLSELENQVVGDLQAKYGFTGSISFHSYSELILWPWSYTGKIQCKDHAAFEKYGVKLGEIFDYEPMQSADLYPAAGDSDDYLYAEHGVLAYTIELGRRFVPSESEVPKINRKGVKALRYFFLNARDPFAEGRQNKSYALAMKLEKAVSSLYGDRGNLPEALHPLKEVSREDLDSAMDFLKMDLPTRYRIFSGLRSLKLHR